MKLSEYIKVLQEFAATHEDLEVVLTQSGYYSDGDFADMYNKPEINLARTYIILGHSHQSG